MKKRLLKDLPFENLVAGTVLYRVNGSYQIDSFKRYYESGGSSSGPTNVMDKSEKEVIDVIWDNEDWFESAELKHVDIVLSMDSVTLRFKTMSADDVESFAKGIQRILPHLADDSYTWNKFSNITTKIKN
jgi:hypothetical protein